MDKIKTSTTKVSYGVGNLGYSVVSQTINSFIIFFGTSVAGIPGGLVGLAVAIGTFWDAITDPIVGSISDNTKNGFLGKRQTFVFISGIIMALSSLLIWNIPMGLSALGKFAWLIITLLVYETADTFFATPYNALGYEIATNSKDNTKIQAVKSVFYLIGMMLPSIILSIISSTTQSPQAQIEKTTYTFLGMVTASLCILCTIIFTIGTKNLEKNNINLEKITKKTSFFAIFAEFFRYFKNKNYIFLISGYSVSTVASCFLTSIGLHVFTYSFHFSTIQISTLLASLIIGAIISQIFIIKMANKHGKVRTLTFYLKIVVFAIAILSIMFILRELFDNNILFWIILFLIIICGFGSGALYNLPFSIFSDLIAEENEKNGSNSTALQSGIMTFIYKCTNAFSLLLIGLLLDIIKFNSSEPVQALQVQNKLGIILIASVSLSIVISIALFSTIKQNRTNQ